MSEVIDQRTVEMRFDNQNFEKNVESSLGTIDKLKKSLNFQDSVKGIEVFEKSLNSLNLKNVRESVDGVTDSFHNMLKTVGNVYLIRKGVEAFNGLENAAKNVIKSMTGINNMKAGWGKYESKVTSVQTIMNATGRTIDDVSRALDKLNWYSDETSASFTDMVDNIGKFTSAGVKLEDATAAMQGVFNWASTSGGNKNQAARAMYNLSQAISVGSMKLMDWKSIENAQMSTVEFKQTVLDTGVALGKLIKTGDKYYTKIGKKQEITAKNFSTTLNTGWLDSELLVSVLKRYSEFSDNVYQYMEEHPEIDTAKDAMDAMREAALESGDAFDDLGYKWFKAAQEAKTFTDVVDSIKDAASTGWMKTFEYIFGNYEQAQLMWSDLAEDLYDVFIAPLNKQNDFIKDALTSNYSKLKDIIVEAGLSVEEFEEKVYNSTETNAENKKLLDKLILDYGNLSNAIDAGQVPAELIRKAFVQLSESGEEVEKTIPTLEEVQQIIKDTWSGKYGNGEERFEAYRNLGYDAQKLQRLVSIFAKKGTIELSDLEEVGIEFGQSYSKTWKELIDANGELIDSLDELSGRELLIGSFRNALKSLFKGVNAFREGAETVFSVSPDSVKNLLQNVYKITSAFALSDERAEQFKELVVAMGQPLKSVGVVAKKFIGGLIGDSFDGLIPKTQKYFGIAFDSIYTFQRRAAKVFKSLEDFAYVNKAVKRFSEAVNNFSIDAGIKFSELGTKIQGYFQKTFVGSAIRKYATRWSSIWAEMNTGGQNAFDTLIRAGKEFRKQWIDSHGEDWNFFSSLKNGIQRDFEKFKVSKLFENIRKPFESLYKRIDKLFGKNEKAIIDSTRVKAGLEANLNTFKDTIFDIFKSVTNIDLQKIIDGIKLLSDPKKIWKSFKKNWNTFVEGFDSVIPALSSAKVTFLNAFKSGKNIFKSLSDGYKEFMLSFAENMTGGINGWKKINLNDLKKSLADNFWPIYDTIDRMFEKNGKKGIKGTAVNIGGGLLESLKPYLEEIKTTLSSFWNWAKPLLKTIGENFAKDLNLTSLSALFTSLATLRFSSISKSISDFFKTLKQETKNFSIGQEIKTACEGIADAFTPLKETKGNLKARSVLAVAASIGIIAASIYAISKIPVDAVWRSVEIVAGITAVVAGLTVLVSKLNFMSFSDSLASTGQVIKMLAVILTISIALKNVGTAAQGMAKAVDMLMGAIEKLSDLAANKVKFQEGLRAVQDLILALGAGSFMAGFLTIGNIFGGTALTLLGMAGSVRILVTAVEQITEIAKINPDALDQAIDNIGQLMISLGKATFWSGFLQSGNWKAAIGRAMTITAFVTAIKVLQNNVIELANYSNPEKIKNAVDAISQLLSSLGSASFWSGLTGGLFGLGSLGKAASILAMGKTIEMFVKTIEQIMKLSVNKERFEAAKGVIYESLAMITVIQTFTGILNAFNMGSSFAQAAGIVSFGIAISLIGSTIESLAKLNAERIKQGGIAVGAVALAITLFMGAMGAVNKWGNLSIKGIGSAAMIVSFAMAIKNIADTVIKLSEVDPEKLKKGGNAAGQIAVVVGIFTALSSKFSGKTNRGGFGTNFLAMAAGIYVFGMAVQKLGEMDDDVLKKGGASVLALITVVGLMTALMNKAQKVPSWSNAGNITALAGAVWVLADAAKTFADMNKNQLLKAACGIGGLLTALTLISRFGLKSGDLGTLLNSGALLLIAGAVSLLAEIAKSFADMEWEQMGKIGAAFGGMIVAVIAMSNFVKIGSKISLLSIGKFGLVIAEIGVILAALGALYKIPGLSGWMSSGGDFLGSIGRAIGKFFGAIIGGFREGITDSMPAVGTAMSEFATNATAFFELMDRFKDINPMDALTQLSKALDKTIWAEIWSRLFQIFPEGEDPRLKSLEAFGNGLKAFAPGFSEFLGSFDDKDTTKLTDVSESLQKLNDISKDQQWIMENPLASDNPLLNFAKAINEAAEEIGKAIVTFNGLEPVNGNATKAIESLAAIGNIDTGENFNLNINTPFFNAVLSWKEQSMTDFATDLSTAIGNIRTFVDAANDFQFQSYGNKLKTTVLAEMLTEMASVPVPATGGIYTFWKDYSGAITSFVSDMLGALPDLRSFISQVNNDTEDPNMTKIDNIIGIITKMAGIVMPVNDGTTFMTFEQLIGHYQGALAQIGSLANEINTTYAEDIDTVHKLTDIFEPFMLKKEDINFDALEGMPEKIKGFVDDLNKTLSGASIDETISDSLKGLADLLASDMKEIGFSEAATDITGGLSNLASINQDNGANTLDPAMDTINTFVGVVKKLMRIQNDFKETIFSNNLSKMITLINENMAKITSGSRTNMNRMREFFESVKELYGDKYHFETGAGNKFGTLISSLVTAIDMFSPNTSVDELKSYTDWMEDLAGKQDMFESAGKAIGAFAVDADKLNSVTSFIDALKGEFNFTPGDSIFKTDPGETGGHWEKMAGYFSAVASDIVDALTILKGSGENSVDFTEFDTLTLKLSSLATAMAQFTGTNNVSEKMKALVKGINDAILGDGTDENPGIKDFGDKLSQFDTLQPVFDQLSDWEFSGLKDVVPNILSGISNAIDNFSFDPNGIQLLKDAMTGIREALDMLDGENGFKTNENTFKYQGNTSSSQPNEKSKRVDFQLGINYHKRDKKLIDTENDTISKFSDAINNTDIDPTKADLLISVSDSITEAAEGISKDSPSSMAKFVQVLADSITDNSDITHESADVLIQDMLTVLDNYIEKFIAAGVNFVKAIASGIENTPDAVEMAATMATRILTQFTLAAQTFGGQKGKEMLDSVLGGLTSPESKEAVNAAFESLFGSDENLGTGITGESGSIGKRIGSTFAADFMEGFSTNLNFGEGENFSGIFQSITELISQLSSMDGNEAGMEFSTFMTDFAESAAKVMEGDAGQKIQETCDTLSSAIGSAVPDGEGLGYSFVEGIRDGLLRGIADFGAEISMLAGYLGGLMNSGTATVIQSASPSKTAMQLGGYFVEGLKLGIEKNLSQAYGAGASVGNAAVDGTTKTLDINSPSKVLYDIGEYAVEGFVNGVKNTTGEAVGAFSDIANLSIDEAMMLINMLQNASGPVSFKGRTWNKGDIDYLRQYISSIQNATSATEKLSKNMESASNAEGPVKNGASGGGGGNGQASDKKNNNIITTDVKGNKLTIHEVGTVLKGIIENGGFKSSYEYNGTEYNFKDLPREFISANKDYFTKMFGNYEGFIPGLESLLSINHEALNNVGDGINKLSNVWEFDEIKVGLTKDAIYSLSEQQSGLFNSAVNRIISETAQSTKHEQSNSVSSSNSNGKSTGGNVYNFNQNIVGSKAASRAEIYRQTKNQFSQLKALDSKSAPYVPILT